MYYYELDINIILLHVRELRTLRIHGAALYKWFHKHADLSIHQLLAGMHISAYDLASSVWVLYTYSEASWEFQQMSLSKCGSNTMSQSKHDYMQFDQDRACVCVYIHTSSLKKSKQIDRVGNQKQHVSEPIHWTLYFNIYLHTQHISTY